MKTAKRTSAQLGPVLLSISIVLAAWNWYLKPARAAGWAASILLLACMMVVLRMANRRTQSEETPRISRPIPSAIVFAALMMTLALGAKLANTLGVLGDHDFAQRGLMVILGFFLMFTGNAIPKTLAPLASLQCDPAKVQAFQRLAGWTWVLTGLGYAMAWLLMPIDAAQPTSLVLLVCGMLAIAAQIVRLRRSRRTEA